MFALSHLKAEQLGESLHNTEQNSGDLESYKIRLKMVSNTCFKKKTFCVKIFLSVCFHFFSLFLSLCLSLYTSVWLLLSLSLSVSVRHCPSLPVSVCLCLSLSVPVCFTLSLSFFFFLCFFNTEFKITLYFV